LFQLKNNQETKIAMDKSKETVHSHQYYGHVIQVSQQTPLISTDNETVIIVDEAPTNQNISDCCLGFWMGLLLCLPGVLCIIGVRNKKEYCKGWLIPMFIPTVIIVLLILREVGVLVF
jgi:hypothetical protein